MNTIEKLIKKFTDLKEELAKQGFGVLGGGMAMAEKAETKHDRCAEEVKEKSPDVKNPHAVCVAAGVKPEKWKKSGKEYLSLAKNGQWSLHKGKSCAKCNGPCTCEQYDDNKGKGIAGPPGA